MSDPSYQLSEQEVLSCIAKLPQLPAVARGLVAHIDETMDVDQLEKQISVEPAIVAKLLQLANSSFYGLSRQVASIHGAVLVIGTRAVSTLATCIAYAKGFEQFQGRQFVSFWHHSVATAICARAIARRIGANGEEAFAIGLLHDIGELVLEIYFPSHVAAVLAYRKQNDCSCTEAENHILGITHAEVGAMLATRWKFPERMCAAILGHHESEDDKKTCLLTAIVNVADHIANATDLDKTPDAAALLRIEPYRQALNLSSQDIEAVLTELETQFQCICSILTE